MISVCEKPNGVADFVYPSFINPAHHRCYFYSTYPPRIADLLWKCDCIAWEIFTVLLAASLARR